MGINFNPTLTFSTNGDVYSVTVGQTKVFLQFNLQHLYKLQRDLFLIMAGKKLEELLNEEQFQTLWEFSVRLKVENLFTKILARKHLRLLDIFATFLKIGDV